MIVYFCTAQEMITARLTELLSDIVISVQKSLNCYRVGTTVTEGITLTIDTYLMQIQSR